MPTPDPSSANAPDRPPSAGGGFFFIIALLVGVAAGVAKGQPTIGFLAGAAVGAAILLGMWLYARR